MGPVPYLSLSVTAPNSPLTSSPLCLPCIPLPPMISQKVISQTEQVTQPGLLHLLSSTPTTILHPQHPDRLHPVSKMFLLLLQKHSSLLFSVLSFPINCPSMFDGSNPPSLLDPFPTAGKHKQAPPNFKAPSFLCPYLVAPARSFPLFSKPII